MKPEISLVRYKKDLRVQDHEPLFEAIQQWNPVIAIYCFEPCITNHPTYSGFHDQIVKESLIDLTIWLESYNIPLLIFDWSVEKILQIFNKYFTISLYSHQEIWHWVSYQRDINLTKRCSEHTVQWNEYQTNGIIRKLRNRDLRDGLWKKQILKTQIILPKQYTQNQIPLPDKIRKYLVKIDSKKTYPAIQPGWETIAHNYLQSFLDQRYKQYLYDVWKPTASRTSCSRLSVALAYGNLSIRQVYQASQSLKSKLTIKKSEYQLWSPEHTTYKSLIRHLNSFISRLHRHDHFIQKFETEVEYETRNIHPYYDQIRTTPNEERLSRFEAWMTWFPLVDAAIRCVRVTWRLNFRLRATLTSFICNTCLQHRKRPAVFLSQYWSDYEPWIHYPQFQMQAWTTWINQYRIYNPTKQMLEKDPSGEFVDIRCPELKHIPMPYKAEPWKLNEWLFQWWFGVKLWADYPLPLFDLEEQNKTARKVLWDLKKQPWFREIANSIYLKHGSRMKQRRRWKSIKKIKSQ